MTSMDKKLNDSAHSMSQAKTMPPTNAPRRLSSMAAAAVLTAPSPVPGAPRDEPERLPDSQWPEEAQAADNDEGDDGIEAKERIMAHRIRLAVYDGGSNDPKQNLKLNTTIGMALDNGLLLSQVHQIIDKCDGSEINLSNRYLIQIRFGSHIYLVCPVNVASLPELKRQIAICIRNYHAGFVYVMPKFHHAGFIEAVISPKIPVSYEQMDERVGKDVLSCGAKAYEVLDYTTGGINVICHPWEMPQVAIALKKRGYKVLHTEYAFNAKEKLVLDKDEYVEYEKFLRRLQKFPEILAIYDNVAHPEED